jgi:hypothetical protein
MQDVVPPPRQSTTQPPVSTDDTPIQPEIVSDLPVKAQDVSSSQAQADNPSASSLALNLAPSNRAAGQDDKRLDKVLKDVNQKIKADDNKPPKPGFFKRWESTIVIVLALMVAAALCLAAVLAFKSK